MLSLGPEFVGGLARPYNTEWMGGGGSLHDDPAAPGLSCLACQGTKVPGLSQER